MQEYFAFPIITRLRIWRFFSFLSFFSHSRHFPRLLFHPRLSFSPPCSTRSRINWNVTSKTTFSLLLLLLLLLLFSFPFVSLTRNRTPRVKKRGKRERKRKKGKRCFRRWWNIFAARFSHASPLRAPVDSFLFRICTRLIFMLVTRVISTKPLFL